MQQPSQPLVSTLIKGSVQNQGYGENSTQPNVSRPLLTHLKDGAEGKFDHQTSKVSKDSLIYSAADDERQTAHQKSTLSGTSEEQLSSHLVSDQQMFLRNPVSELALGRSQNIQIQDFSKHQDLGKLIINESVPRGEALTSTFNQAGSFKKSSKRVTASETTVISGSSDIKSTSESTQEVIRSSPVQTTRIGEVVSQNRDQTYLRHETISQQPTSTQFLHPNQAVSNLQVQQTQLTFRSELQNQTAQIPEKFVPTLPLTAGLQSQPVLATSAQIVPPMVSSTGHSTPAEHSQRTDRITTQHSAGPVKPVTSSLLAGRSAAQLNPQQHQVQQQQPTQLNPHNNQHQDQQAQPPQHKSQLPPKPQSERASSSSGTQRTQNPVTSPNAVLSAASNTAHANITKSAQTTPVLALRTSQSQSQTHSVQDKVVSRTLAATPEVLEYVRTHQGQLPQDTVITHPPKVVAEYTLDAEGRRVAYGSQEGQMSERKIEQRPVAGQQQPLDGRTKPPERNSVEAPRVPLQSQTIAQNANQVRNFGQERVHQIDEDVIIENKPYIIDPRTKQKIYVDPNNLSAYVSLFKAQQTKAPNSQNLLGEHSNDGKPRGVLRTSNHVPQQVSVNTDPALVRLSPQTHVVQVPKPTHTGINPQTLQRSSNSVSKVHTTAPRASPNNTSGNSFHLTQMMRKWSDNQKDQDLRSLRLRSKLQQVIHFYTRWRQSTGKRTLARQPPQKVASGPRKRDPHPDGAGRGVSGPTPSQTGRSA